MRRGAENGPLTQSHSHREPFIKLYNFCSTNSKDKIKVDVHVMSTGGKKKSGKCFDSCKSITYLLNKAQNERDFVFGWLFFAVTMFPGNILLESLFIP